MPGPSSLITPEEAKLRFARRYTPRPRGPERVALEGALGRVLAREAVAPEDVPGFDRSTVDGYAVRAQDVSTAREAAPVQLVLVGEVLMGEAASVIVAPGTAAQVPTGGMIPPGADAVVMLEDVEVRDDRRVAARRQVRPGDNILRRAEDVRAGDVALRPGTRLRPQDVGLLAAIGVTDVEVFARPLVAIVATGDEIVPPSSRPGSGQVRDANTYAIGALVRQGGGEPRSYGIVGDTYDVLFRTLAAARTSCDLLLVSGGTSVGEKDAVARAIGELGAPGVIVHGVNIKPGKPTILAVVDGTPIVGLPGNPVSGMVIFDVFVRDLLRGLAGEEAPRPFGRVVRAKTDRRIPSDGVREDHIRVHLATRGETLWAVPVLGKSGIITTMTRADGIIVVPAGQKAVDEGTVVDVHLFPS
ncbi:MAG TPA: gephyrin-like molybdotransferase Glp [bacterium]|nr:gephyrin-like molybdotransferase Glp [bacterium]